MITDPIHDIEDPAVKDTLLDYLNKARALETYTINDLEKHLWLANGGALTISIGFIQAKANIDQLQLLGAWAFCSGILFLVLLKFVSAYNSARDHYRVRNKILKTAQEGITFQNWPEISADTRDSIFKFLNRIYRVLQMGAGAFFILGCFLTLVGITNTSYFQHSKKTEQKTTLNISAPSMKRNFSSTEKNPTVTRG